MNWALAEAIISAVYVLLSTGAIIQRGKRIKELEAFIVTGGLGRAPGERGGGMSGLGALYRRHANDVCPDCLLMWCVCTGGSLKAEHNRENPRISAERRESEMETADLRGPRLPTGSESEAGA